MTSSPPIDPRSAITASMAVYRTYTRDQHVSPVDRRHIAEAVTDELFNPLAPLLAAGAGLSAAVGSFGDASMVGGVGILGSDRRGGVAQW